MQAENDNLQIVRGRRPYFGKGTVNARGEVFVTLNIWGRLVFKIGARLRNAPLRWHKRAISAVRLAAMGWYWSAWMLRRLFRGAGLMGIGAAVLLCCREFANLVPEFGMRACVIGEAVFVLLCLFFVGSLVDDS